MVARKWRGVVAALLSFSSFAVLASRARPQSPVTPAATQLPNVYEDDRIRVTIPEGWTLSKPTETFMSVPGTWETDTVPGALLTKGKYKLYLLTHHGQASGVEGGRFGEISPFVSPWLYAGDTCDWYIHPETTKVTVKLSRVDNYYDTAHPTVPLTQNELPKNCGQPPAAGVFWYGSFFQQACPAVAKTPEDTDCGGYFLFYPDLIGKHADNMDASAEMTFSLTYATADSAAGPPPVPQLPRQGDPDLRKMLDEASAIVKSITYK